MISPNKIILIQLVCILIDISVINSVRVAIIGSGIGGSSAAYYLLKNSFSNNSILSDLKVDIYEKNDRVGGRVYSPVILGEPTNLGASFLIKENQLITRMINELNITTETSKEADGSIGIFNNRTILFEIGYSDISDIAKIVWRYGLFSPLMFKYILSEKLKLFQNTYKSLDNKITFNTLKEFLLHQNFQDLVSKTTKELLRSYYISESYIDELVNTIIVGIYNQHSEINAYAGMIALIGSGNTPLDIVGGNDVLIKTIIATNKVDERFNIFMETSVTEVVKSVSTNATKYTIKSDKGISEEYDIVIIACPILKTGIKFSTNIVIPDKDLGPSIFVAPYSIFVRGLLNKSYFSLAETDAVPNTLLTDDKSKNIVIQLGTVSENVYRITSVVEITPEMLVDGGYFLSINEVIEKHHWDFAYPQFVSIKDLDNLPSFVLDEGLYYINAIESAGSCMELSMISARNIVNIIEKKSFGLGLNGK